MQEITSNEQFKEAIQSASPTVVTWYTTWCPDCHRIEPFMPEVEKQYQDRFEFVKIDRDKFPDEAREFEVIGIPSFIVFQNGASIARFVSRDAKTREQIEQFLNDVHLAE